MSGSNLSAAAAAVVRRLVLVHWFALLARTSVATFSVLLLAACAGIAWSGVRPPLGWAIACTLVCVLAWLAGTAAWVWSRRPSPVRALATWDESTARHEMFVSAYVFALKTAPTPAEELHLRRARPVLEQELRGLRRQIPVTCRHRVWLAPLVLMLLVIAAGFWRPVAASVPGISAQSRERVKEVAATLAEKARTLGPLAGLDEAERKRLEALKQSLQEAAKSLPQLEGATPRQTLGELEERARSAESLAESLGEADAEKLSAEMLAEMQRHADTADLAAALRADEAQQIADEAHKLADQLADKNMPREQRKRIADAFKKSLAAASEKDRKSALGKQLSDVQQQLERKQPGLASKRLRELAQSMNRRSQRQRSAQHLQQLARNLRRAGQQIFGRQNSGLQKLSQNQQPPAGQGGLQRAGNQRPIPLGQFMPGAAPQPGARQAGQAQAGQAPAGQPQAATPANPGGGQPAGMPPVPGSGPAPQPAPGAGNQPGGLAAIPVPGSQPGASPGANAGAGQSPGSGAAPVPGSAASSGSGNTPGGLQAGTGSAALGNAPVAPLKAARQGVVQAQVGAQGTSRSRAVNALPQPEQAQQDARRVAIDFIKVEEEALADEPLPAGRREQVRRYFDSLRKQLSAADSPTEPKHDE